MSDSLSDAAQKFNLLCGVQNRGFEEGCCVFRDIFLRGGESTRPFRTKKLFASNQDRSFLGTQGTTWNKANDSLQPTHINSHARFPLRDAPHSQPRAAQGIAACGPPLSCARASAIDRTARNTKVRGNRRERERERERGQWQAIATITVLRWRAENAQPALACLLTRASGRVPAYLFA